MNDTPPPTIRELAEKLGLSSATVSYALRHHPCVAEKTRKRVLKAAKDAGYQSNLMINALMTQVRLRSVYKRPASEEIAFLHASEEEDGWKHIPSIQKQYEGACQRAKELGLSIQPLWIGHQGERSKQIARIIWARGIRGTIIAPLPIQKINHFDLRWDMMSPLAISYTFSQQKINRIVHHHMKGTMECFSKLQTLGYKRIGLVIWREENMGHIWIAGYLTSQYIYKTYKIPVLILDTDDPKSFFKWQNKYSPDAVVAVHGWGHLPLKWLRSRNVKIPQDIGYASLDVDADHKEKITGIQQDNHGIGSAAVSMVANALLHNEIGIPPKPSITMFDGTWVDGATTCQQ